MASIDPRTCRANAGAIFRLMKLTGRDRARVSEKTTDAAQGSRTRGHHLHGFRVGCDDDPFSPLSPAARSQTALGIGSPTLTTHAASPYEIDLLWPDNSANEIGWEVHRSTTGSAGAFTPLALLKPDTTYYANTGLTALTEYCYKVRFLSSPEGSADLGENRSTHEAVQTQPVVAEDSPPLTHRITRTHVLELASAAA